MRAKLSPTEAVVAEALSRILESAKEREEEEKGKGESKKHVIEFSNPVLQLPPSDNRLAIKVSGLRGEPGQQDDIENILGLPPIRRPKPPFGINETEVERVLSHPHSEKRSDHTSMAERLSRGVDIK